MGFVHGERYKITSGFDRAVFDVAGAKTKDGAKTITFSWTGDANKIWTANGESGGFRLTASHVTDNIKVLDQGSGSNRIGQRIECAAFNEHDPNIHWRLTPLSG